MLKLDSPRWAGLEHAYGPSGDIPALLSQLETFPMCAGDDEPWFSLWSALCHQQTIYSASLAAVPHIIRIMERDPVKADYGFLALPASIEIARARQDVSIAQDLRESYQEAISRLPSLVALAAARPWNEDFICSALAALAASKGYPTVAEAAFELDLVTAEKFGKWFAAQ